MKKLVVLDFISQITYVIPYDTNVFEDAIECISTYFDGNNISISIDNLQFMEVENFNLIII